MCSIRTPVPSSVVWLSAATGTHFLRLTSGPGVSLSPRPSRSALALELPGSCACWTHAAGPLCVRSPFACSGLVGVLDTRMGRLLRTVNVGMDPHDQILVDTRRERVFVPVYSQTGNGHVSVLDARTGRPLYAFAAGKAPVWMAMDAR